MRLSPAKFLLYQIRYTSHFSLYPALKKDFKVSSESNQPGTTSERSGKESAIAKGENELLVAGDIDSSSLSFIEKLTKETRSSLHPSSTLSAKDNHSGPGRHCSVSEFVFHRGC